MGDSLVFTAGQVLCAAGYGPFWLSVIILGRFGMSVSRFVSSLLIGAQNVCDAAQMEKYFKKSSEPRTEGAGIPIRNRDFADSADGNEGNQEE